jgi:hypothetical protein
MKYKTVAIAQPKAMNTMRPSSSSSPMQMNNMANAGIKLINDMPKKATAIKRPAGTMVQGCGQRRP